VPDGGPVVVDVVVDDVVTVELVVGSVVVEVVLVAAGDDVDVLVVVRSRIVDDGSVGVTGVVDGALASAPLHADNSITATTIACFDVALRPAMRGRSYGRPRTAAVDARS
jgi:hypothetical protein